MPRTLSPEIKAEIVRRRVELRHGAMAISKDLGVAFETVRKLLKPYPLTDEERTERKRLGSGLKRGKSLRERQPSALFAQFGHEEFSNNEKAKIAEAAVLLRLQLLRLQVYGAVYGGDKVDWVVLGGPENKLVKVQVRWTRTEEYGAPFARTQCSDGRGKTRAYRTGEFDIFVGYDFYTDTAYVLTFEEVTKCKKAVSMPDSAEEAWEKLLALVS